MGVAVAGVFRHVAPIVLILGRGGVLVEAFWGYWRDWAQGCADDSSMYVGGQTEEAEINFDGTSTTTPPQAWYSGFPFTADCGSLGGKGTNPSLWT